VIRDDPERERRRTIGVVPRDGRRAPMDIPYPLAIALVAATYGFIAVGAWVM
jgi:hypothetical protein